MLNNQLHEKNQKRTIKIDYSSFKMNENSILFSLLETTDQFKESNSILSSFLKKKEMKDVKEINQINHMNEMKVNETFSNSFYSLSMLSLSLSPSSETDTDSSDHEKEEGIDSMSSEEMDGNQCDETNIEYTEEDKRKDIFRLNRQHTNRLKQLNVQLNNAYNVWKEKEQNGEEYEEYQLKWSYLNERYRVQKRKASREIYDKVQQLYRKIYPTSKVHDLHGQGIKSGSFLYIVKKVIHKEQESHRKDNKLIDSTERHSVTFDVGDKNDGEWHLKALLIMVTFLQEKGYEYHMDPSKRFITIYL